MMWAIRIGTDALVAACLLLIGTRAVAIVSALLVWSYLLLRLPSKADPRVLLSRALVTFASFVLLIDGSISAFRVWIVVACSATATVNLARTYLDDNRRSAAAVVVCIVPLVFVACGTGASSWGTPYWPLAGLMLYVASGVIYTGRLPKALYIGIVLLLAVTLVWSPLSVPHAKCHNATSLVNGACECASNYTMHELHDVCYSTKCVTSALDAVRARFIGANGCMCNSPSGEYIAAYRGCKCSTGFKGLLCGDVDVAQAA